MDRQAIYLRAIQDTYPNLEIHSARLHSGEGQFNDVVFVNEELVFRFPRYHDNIPGFLQELELLQKLQGRLRLPIPDPIFTSAGTRSPGKVFMGYKILPGKPLFRPVLNSITDNTALDSFARQLAHFLHDLHRLSPIDLGLDLPVPDQLDQDKELFSKIQKHLFAFMRPDSRAAVAKHFQDYFDNAGIHEHEPCLIHGDFGGSNILHEQDAITGVIDFSFAGLGDPARDIAALSTLGEDFFSRFNRYYDPSPAMLARARFYRGTFALQEALHGVQNND